VYEPVESIGTGQNATIQDIMAVKEKLHITPQQKFIYGGSVTAENSKQYLQNPYIDGVLPGGASLDPEQFYIIVRSAL
jgi:triosephosphate isomerase